MYYVYIFCLCLGNFIFYRKSYGGVYWEEVVATMCRVFVVVRDQTTKGVLGRSTSV